MYAKIEITGVIEACTGLHIGGSSQFAAIGAVDSPVIRDALTDKPMIPGSSLKGKMRALLAKRYNCGLCSSPEDDDEKVVRLFGSAREHKCSRLIFSDMMLMNEDALKKVGIASPTEVKFENSINRMSAVANPRQIERAIRGTQYNFRMIYDAYKISEDEIVEDFHVIREGLSLLQYDYIGGSGSRGYGKIAFKDLDAELVMGEMDETIVETCRSILKEV
jgi:CRISPR-associated protein Csm3